MEAAEVSISLSLLSAKGETDRGRDRARVKYSRMSEEQESQWVENRFQCGVCMVSLYLHGIRQVLPVNHYFPLQNRNLCDSPHKYKEYDILIMCYTCNLCSIFLFHCTDHGTLTILYRYIFAHEEYIIICSSCLQRDHILAFPAKCSAQFVYMFQIISWPGSLQDLTFNPVITCAYRCN